MDADLWFRLLVRWKVGYVGKCLAGFRSHPVSLEWTMMQIEEDLAFIHEVVMHPAVESVCSPEFRHTLCSRMVRNAARGLMRFPPSAERDKVIAALREEYGQKFTSNLVDTTPGTDWGFKTRRALANVLVHLPVGLRWRIGELADTIRFRNR
jgi:hypothetical protein